MKVVLLGCIQGVEKIIAACSRATRREETPEVILDGLNEDEARRSVGRVLARGHEGVLEFAYFIFSISGVSRVLTHQLVRHRIASYLQMSSREVDLSSAAFIVPPEIKRNPKMLKMFNEAINDSVSKYGKLVASGVKYEDARYLLPEAIKTHITMATNARSLNHLFGLRLCNRAQWEIRELARLMRETVKPIAPSLFWSEIRPCVARGYCPEGKSSCGFWKTSDFKRERGKFRKGYPNE